MANFAEFDQDGFPVAFYSEDIMGYRKTVIDEKITYDDEGEITGITPVIGDNPNCNIPISAIELTDDQYEEFLNFSGLRKWVGGSVIEYEPPVIESVIIIPSVTFWERLTESEADEVYALFESQPVRIRQIFTTAQTYRSDHELWPLLQQVASELFGAQRAGELLAQP